MHCIGPWADGHSVGPFGDFSEARAGAVEHVSTWRDTGNCEGSVVVTCGPRRRTHILHLGDQCGSEVGQMVGRTPRAAGADREKKPLT